MYHIKSIPEDFIVEEIPLVELKTNGIYIYFWLIKRDCTTINAVQEIANFLHIPAKYIGVAGNKDKLAVTKQLCSLKITYEKQLKQFIHKLIKIEIAGYGDERIAAGLLKGNYFQIIVRDADKIPSKKEWFINYFGTQRFSSDNIEIGKAILQQNFRLAVELLQESQKKFISSSSSTDFIQTIKKVPNKILRLIINAYQSDLWNKIITQITKNTLPSENLTVQLPGFGFEENQELRTRYEQLLEKDNLSLESFIVRSLPDISCEACERKVWIQVTNMTITQNSDKTILLTFTLPKGSYATEVIRQLF